MSTRKSTRATSRAASSVGASPMVSTADIPSTPRRSNRRGGSVTGASLPSLTARQSTAYGTNTIPPPAHDGPPVADTINGVLGDILEPVHASSRPGSTAGSRVGRAKTPKQAKGSSRASPVPNSEKSFNDESAMFHAARIESSVISEDPNDLSNIPEMDEPGTDEDKSDTPPASIGNLNGDAERQYLVDIARSRVFEARARNGQPYLNYFDIATEFLGKAWNACKKYLAPFVVGLVGLLLISLLSNSQFRSYGWDLKSNIGQFIPYPISHPMDAFMPSEIQVINRRLNDLEYKVSMLASRPSDLDPKALKTIEHLLPDFLVVKKDKFGNLVIPANFWNALRGKIREDDTLLRDQADKAGKTSFALTGQMKDLMHKFIRENQAELAKLNDADFAEKFPQLLKENHIVARNEVLDLIQQNWLDNKEEVKSEMHSLKKKLDQATRQISDLKHDFHEESKAIAHDVLRKFIPSGQLDALASANLKHNLNYGLTRLNHLSKGTGAAIDPHLTSPKYIFPSMDVWFPKRLIRRAIGNSIPVPNSPDTALMKWEEHGDCWCSPSKAGDGSGPSLAVLMGSSIYPDQVVVEHITPTASLQPGAAPREMELLAWIPDPELFRAVKKVSDTMFPNNAEEPLRTDGWVRIATWTYDLEDSQNVQAFTVQMDMKALGAHTNKVIVRSKNNWGGDVVDYTCLYRVRLHGEVFATPGLY